MTKPQDDAARIAELEEENARLRRLDVEYGQVETAIIMADRQFDGDSDHATCGERLIASVDRLRDEAKAEAEAVAQLRAAASQARLALAGMIDPQAAIDALDKVLGKREAAAPAASGTELRMIYRNWRGEVAPRRIRAEDMTLWHGATEWHPEPQPLLRAFDLDKKAWRDFAVQDCDFLFGQRADGVIEQAAAPCCSKAKALEAIINARPMFAYLAVTPEGPDFNAPGSPYDRGKADGYAELQKIAQAAMDSAP